MRFTPTGSPFAPLLTVHADGVDSIGGMLAHLLTLLTVYPERALEVVVKPSAWLVSEAWA